MKIPFSTHCYLFILSRICPRNCPDVVIKMCIFFFSVKFYCVVFFNTIICLSCILTGRNMVNTLCPFVHLLAATIAGILYLRDFIVNRILKVYHIIIAFSSKLPSRTLFSETVKQNNRQIDRHLPILSSICHLSLWTPARRQWLTAVFQMTSELTSFLSGFWYSYEFYVHAKVFI